MYLFSPLCVHVHAVGVIYRLIECVLSSVGGYCPMELVNRYVYLHKENVKDRGIKLQLENDSAVN